MGAILKFLLFFGVIYFLMRGFSHWITNLGRRARGYNSQDGRTQTEKEPETQEERILDYQKRKFENMDVQDVEFEEVKKTETNH